MYYYSMFYAIDEALNLACAVTFVNHGERPRCFLRSESNGKNLGLSRNPPSFLGVGVSRSAGSAIHPETNAPRSSPDLFFFHEF